MSNSQISNISLNKNQDSTKINSAPADILPVTTRKIRILIDLSILKHLHCGLGQIAWNYGEYFKHTVPDDLDITLLVPKSYIGAFGTNVKYKESKRIYRVLPWLLPSYDIWHSIHQISHYKPSRLWSKNILTIHDLNYLYEEQGNKRRRYLLRVQKRILRANYLTAISYFTKEDIDNHMVTNEKPLTVIYNGVELLDASKAIKPAGIKDKNRPFFFTIGQITAKKNFHTLLDVLKLYPEYDLFIAGQDHREYAQAIKQRILDEHIQNVFLIGTISTEEKTWLYKNCRAFLFPSLFEGFGLPVIEAMMFKKPVFCAYKTSLPEIGNRYAFYWNSFDAQSMKNVMDAHLQEFYSDPQFAKEMETYAFSFSYEKHMQKYFQVYRTIAKQPNGNRLIALKDKIKEIIKNLLCSYKISISSTLSQINIVPKHKR